MPEIRCPHCGTVFNVDESEYAKLLQQVRDKEFEKALSEREAGLKKAQESEFSQRLSASENSFKDLLRQKSSDLEKKETEIERLKGELKLQESDLKSKAQASLRDEQERLQAEIAALRASLESAQKDSQATLERAVRSKEDELNTTIGELKTKLAGYEGKARAELAEALSAKAVEISELKRKVESAEGTLKLKLAEQEAETKKKLEQKDEIIAHYKDLKARLSTKMVGETLEQHCLTVFNEFRMSAFPNAYFEKDNDAASGSKGDFIYRETGEDGTELLSIMFEMKNESEATAVKHKNEDFFDKLDKDRKTKNCEFAVLVSMLELDNEFYNSGITDVSWRYPKMYVIRPQCFITLISILRNAALRAMSVKKELAAYKAEHIDLENFEQNMEEFKKTFGRNYKLASDKFDDAISNIDKAIIQLQRTRDALTSSQNNFRLANDKAEKLTIRKLTRNAPSIAAAFKNSKS